MIQQKINPAAEVRGLDSRWEFARAQGLYQWELKAPLNMLNDGLTRNFGPAYARRVLVTVEDAHRVFTSIPYTQVLFGRHMLTDASEPCDMSPSDQTL